MSILDIFITEEMPHLENLVEVEICTGPCFSRLLTYEDMFIIEEMPHLENLVELETCTGPCFSLLLTYEDMFITEEMPHPVHHDIYLERAGQRRSETRTKFSDQDKEEWKEEPEYGRAGDTWTGARFAPRKPHALRPLLLMGENLPTAAIDIDNDTADQHRSETRRTESSAWGDGPFSPRTFASWMRRGWPTAHCEVDCDFPDQPRTRKSGTQGRKLSPEYTWSMFRTWSAAAVWIMMALTVASSSLAGATCIGTEVKLDKSEAALRCPLPVGVDVSDTRQGIIIKHFSTSGSADTVMYCYWPEGADKPECESSDSFSLEGQLTDQVVAKVPVSRLIDSGDYKCQLYPLGDHKYFTPCRIHHFSDNDEGKRPAVVTTPVVPSTATNHSTPGQDPLISEAPPSVGQSDSVALTAAVLVLQIIIIILLVVNVLYIQNRKNLQGKNKCMKDGWMAWLPWNSSEKKPVTSEGEPMNSLNEAAVIPESALRPHATLQPFLPQSCNLAAVGGLKDQHLNNYAVGSN